LFLEVTKVKPGLKMLQVRIPEELFGRLRLESLRRGARTFQDGVTAVLDDATPHSRIVPADPPETAARRRAKASV
jgi:hypothetical protein